jgi:hypothetical protein
MSGDAYCRATPSRKRIPFICKSLVDIIERNACAHGDDPSGGIDSDISQASKVDHDVLRLREPFVGMSPAPDAERQVIGAHPIDHDGDGMFGLANRAERRTKLSAKIGRSQVAGVFRIGWCQEEHLACGKARQRW